MAGQGWVQEAANARLTSKPASEEGWQVCRGWAGDGTFAAINVPMIKSNEKLVDFISPINFLNFQFGFR